MAKDIILTISLLVSNRPDTIEKCLNSLQNLRDRVSSELILIDTGCGENVRRIIEKYADRIIDFEWCKDFAKARNVGLKAAHGKWFLYLDDDEWFEDTKEIEEFFCSVEWKKYGYALYRQRNYGNREGSIYSDALVGRMARLDEEIEFQYSIHECFSNIKGPTKIFNAYVHHYGYIYDTRKEFYIHSQRNIIPLLAEHRKDEHNLRHQVHLAQEYNGLREYRESIEISLNGIKNYIANSNTEGYINSLFVNVVECYCKTFDFSKALEYAKKYINDSRINALGAAKIYSLLCEIYYNGADYENCITSVKYYMESYKLQQEDPDYFAKYTGLFLYCFDDKEVNVNLGYAVRAAIKLGNAKLAWYFFECIDFRKKPLMLENGMVQDIIGAYMTEDASGTDYYFKMISFIFENRSLLMMAVNFIEKRRTKEASLFQNTWEKWKVLDDKYWYFIYLSIWADNGEAVPEYVSIQYKKMWNETLEVLNKSIKLGIWDLAEREGIDIEEILCGLPFYKWQKAVEIVCQSMKQEELEELNKKISNLNAESRHYLWWKICYLQRTFKEMDGEEKLPDIVSLKENLFSYAESCWKLFQNVYSEEMFSEMSDMLPQCCQVSFYLTDLFQQENQHNFVKMVDDLKQIREINGDFAIPVKHYLKYAGEQMAQQQEEQKKTQAELADIAEAVKVKVRQLIALQKYEEAKAIIAQLEQMLPGDPELSELKKQCE